MEQIVQAVVAGAVALVGELYQVLGGPLAVAVVVTLLAWLAVDRATPPGWPMWKNRLAAALAGVGMTVLAHVAVGAVSYGVGWRGYAAAIFFGLLAGGAAPIFHDFLAARGLTRQGSGWGAAPPAAGCGSAGS